MSGNFVHRGYELYSFLPIFPVSRNILTSLMESWCIVFLGKLNFWGQNQPVDGFRTLCFPAIYKKFRRHDTFFPQTLKVKCKIWKRKEEYKDEYYPSGYFSRSSYLNNRKFLARGRQFSEWKQWSIYRADSCPLETYVLKTSIFALEPSLLAQVVVSKNKNFPRGNYQPIFPRQKHSIV